MYFEFEFDHRGGIHLPGFISASWSCICMTFCPLLSALSSSSSSFTSTSPDAGRCSSSMLPACWQAGFSSPCPWWSCSNLHHTIPSSGSTISCFFPSGGLLIVSNYLRVASKAAGTGRHILVTAAGVPSQWRLARQQRLRKNRLGYKFLCGRWGRHSWQLSRRHSPRLSWLFEGALLSGKECWSWFLLSANKDSIRYLWISIFNFWYQNSFLNIHKWILAIHNYLWISIIQILDIHKSFMNIHKCQHLWIPKNELWISKNE